MPHISAEVLLFVFSAAVVLFFPVYISLILKNQVFKIKIFGINVYKFDFAKNHYAESEAKDDSDTAEKCDEDFSKISGMNFENTAETLKNLYLTLDYVRREQKNFINQIGRIVKIKLRIEFGMINPYQTGILRGYLLFALHLVRSVSTVASSLLEFTQLEIITNFREKIFKFNGNMRFKFNLCQMIYVAFKLADIVKYYKKQTLER